MAERTNTSILASLPAAKPKQLAPLVGVRPPPVPIRTPAPWQQTTVAKTPVDIVKLARREVSPEPVLDAQLPGSLEDESPRPKTPDSSKSSRGRRSTVSANLDESLPRTETRSQRRHSPVDTSCREVKSPQTSVPSSRKLSLPPANPKEHGVIECDAEMDKNLIDALFRAGRQSNYKQVIEILEQHPYLEIDIRDEFQNTLLIVAASQNCKRLLKECLRRGANINAQNWQGNTAAHQAFRFRYHDLGNYILEKGANVMICNEEGQSVLSFAEQSADRIAKQEQISK